MKSLFVGNLAFQTTEGDLRALFERFGEIGHVHLPKDPNTGRARGFGFVEMANDDGAREAIAALNGTVVGSRNINVSEARPRERSGPPRGPGRERHGGSSKDSYKGAARQPREPREPRW